MRGIVTLEARDKDTLELQGRWEQENIITEAFVWTGMRSFYSVNGVLSISDAVFEPSIIPPVVPFPPANGFYFQHRQQDVFGVPSYEVFDKTLSTPTYVQLSGRFLPPTATRTIATVMVSFTPNTTASYYESYNNNVCRAYAKLSVPCIQTTTQVYDIYYRIFFDYEETDSDIHAATYEKMLRRWGITAGGSQYNYDGGARNPVCWQLIYPFATHHIAPADRQTYTQQAPILMNSYLYLNSAPHTTLGFRSNRSPTFTDQLGQIVNGIYTMDPWGNVYGEHNFGDKFSKIQNVISHREQLQTTNANPFLDVDNLPTGTGRVNIDGTWNDEEAHVNDDLYFYRKLPEWNHVEITLDGQVGTAEYKYVRQQFAGLMYWEGNRYHYKHLPVLHMHQPGHADYGLTKFGATDDTVFGVEQLSATIRFDDSSVIIPKKDKVALYSVATSRMYIIAGAFTDVHQVAVRNGIIYIACRATGLWQCNPRTSLTATLVTVGGYRTPDFSKCHGVTVGYNDVLWAVGEDALASYNGTTWTLYDPTTGHPFGASNAIFPRIAYVKADPESATNQLLFVYQPSDPTTALGFWWSTATTVQDTGTQPPLANSGRPRINKSHVGGLLGTWAVRSNDRVYLSAFNGATWTAAAGSTTTGDQVMRAGNSVLWVKDTNNTPYLFQYTGYSEVEVGDIQGADRFFAGYYYARMRYTHHQLLSADGTQHSTVSSSSVVYGEGYHNYCNVGTSARGGYGGAADQHTSFELAPGLRFTLLKMTTGQVGAFVNTYGLATSPHGGLHSWLAVRRYGWNGSAWVYNHASSKVTHADVQPLLDGVTVSFENGTSGTAFRAPNNWRFGLCRGLFKDNATRAQFKLATYYAKTKTGLAPLSSSTVPAMTALTTGLALIDTTNKSNGVTQAGSGEVTFPGNNSGQFAVSTKQVTGDFEVAVNVDQLKAATTHGTTMVGVGKLSALGYSASPANGSQPLVGIYAVSATEWRVVVRGSHVYTGTFTGTTDITIQRLAGIITIKRNGVVVYTVNGASMPPADQRLDLIWVAYFNWSPLLANRTAPAMTVLTNGSDNGIFLGSSVDRTESFNLRFKGVDTFILPVVTLNGVEVPLKTDGTLPAPNEVSIDWQKGAFYFNAADVGKTFTVNCTRVFSQ